MSATNNNDLGHRLLLAKLPGLGPARLRWLMSSGASVAEVAESIRAGRLPRALGAPTWAKGPAMVQTWFELARALDPDDLMGHHTRQGVKVAGPGSSWWPFEGDPEPPLSVTYMGTLGLAVSKPTVAIVGTRRCTTVGRRVAASLGAGLGEAGVSVISGLATGIDAASHVGVLSAGGKAIGVVGTGLDVVYPRSNRELWGRVAEVGLLLSEYPVGTRPENWRFPARNRLIASLADIVVVVESHEKGGSLHTVDEAIQRGRTVMAVPGSVTSAASAGTNQLLVDGCAPVRGVEDVLVALSLETCAGPKEPLDPKPAKPYPASLVQALILDEVGTGAVHIDDLLAASGVAIVDLLAEIQCMVQAGLVALDGSTVLPGANT